MTIEGVVSQSSLLQASLLMLYTDDLPSTAQHFVPQFSDGTFFVIEADLQQTLELRMSIALDNFEGWYRRNNLVLNIGKIRFGNCNLVRMEVYRGDQILASSETIVILYCYGRLI